MGRRIVIDIKELPPPVKPRPEDYAKPEEFPPCARPQGLKATQKATIGEIVARKKRP